MITPTLILPHQGGGGFFRELDAPQLCCGVLHFYATLMKGRCEKEKYLFHDPDSLFDFGTSDPLWG